MFRVIKDNEIFELQSEMQVSAFLAEGFELMEEKTTKKKA